MPLSTMFCYLDMESELKEASTEVERSVMWSCGGYWVVGREPTGIVCIV